MDNARYLVVDRVEVRTVLCMATSGGMKVGVAMEKLYSVTFAEIRTFFRSAVRQHTEGLVGIIIWVLLEIWR